MHEVDYPTFIDLVQGKSYGMEVSIMDLNEVPYDFSSGYTGTLVLKEREGGEALDTLSGSRVMLYDGGATSSTVRIAIDATNPVVDQTGYIQIGLWKLNFHYTAGTGSATAGDGLLTHGGVTGWADLAQAIVDIINTGTTAQTGFTLARSIGANTEVSAALDLPGVGSTIYIDLTSLSGGLATNSITYTLGDSEDTNTSSSSMTSGTDAGRNIELIWSTAETAAILTDSARYKGVANLIGDLELTTGGEVEFSIRLKFKFQQTT